MGVLTGRDEQHVCPVTLAGGLDNRIRRWLQDPVKILAPFVRPGMTALDLGCGPGYFSLGLARLVGDEGKVIAVDLQAGMLDLLRGKVRGTALEQVIQPHQCAADSLCLDSGAAADFALAFYMVHEVPDKARFFREIFAALAPGGKFLLVEPPFHVSKKAFAATLALAAEAGFKALEGAPRVFFSYTALLGKA
ncbi:class I SAM-dependent methyltransferase [bacterium]|nr:class I SAM-dependent methyltransferase [bacterium]